MERETLDFSTLGKANTFAASIAADYAGEEAFVEEQVGNSVVVRYRLIRTIIELRACACAIENDGATASLLTDYFIDTDTGDDGNTGADFSNAWLTLAPLATIPFGKIHIRGSQDTPAINLRQGSFVLVRDGSFTGRIGKLNLFNVLLGIGDTFDDPDETLRLRTINAEENCLIVLDTEHNFLPGGDDAFRVGKNGRLVISSTQTVEGAVNRLMIAFNGGEIYLRATETILHINSPSANYLARAVNGSRIFLTDQRVAAGVNAAIFDISSETGAIITTVPHATAIQNEYATFQSISGGKLLGWDEVPYLGFEENILAEVAGTGTGTIGALLPCDTSGGAATIAPPPDVLVGSHFAVVDSRNNAAANNIVVDFITAGQLLYGASANFILATNGQFARFSYISSAVGWVVES